jgi:peptidoglycan hydrolase-like amidase
MSQRFLSREVIALLLMAIVLTGCAGNSSTNTAKSPSIARAEAAVIASRVAQGGLCASGLCRSTLQVSTTGGWSLTASGKPARTGTLSADQLANLRAAIAASMLDKAPAFTGACPTSQDGQEITYSWSSATGEHTVSSCRSALPAGDPLLVQLNAIASS